MAQEKNYLSADLQMMPESQLHDCQRLRIDKKYCEGYPASDLPTWGDNVKRLREAKGLQQQELARLAHVARSTVSAWENNRKGMPETPTVFRVATALECELGTLLGGIDAEYEAMVARLTGGATVAPPIHKNEPQRANGADTVQESLATAGLADEDRGGGSTGDSAETTQMHRDHAFLMTIRDLLGNDPKAFERWRSAALDMANHPEGVSGGDTKKSGG